MTKAMNDLIAQAIINNGHLLITDKRKYKTLDKIETSSECAKLGIVVDRLSKWYPQIIISRQ